MQILEYNYLFMYCNIVMTYFRVLRVGKTHWKFVYVNYFRDHYKQRVPCSEVKFRYINNTHS